MLKAHLKSGEFTGRGPRPVRFASIPARLRPGAQGPHRRPGESLRRARRHRPRSPGHRLRSRRVGGRGGRGRGSRASAHGRDRPAAGGGRRRGPWPSPERGDPAHGDRLAQPHRPARLRDRAGRRGSERRDHSSRGPLPLGPEARGAPERSRPADPALPGATTRLVPFRQRRRRGRGLGRQHRRAGSPPREPARAGARDEGGADLRPPGLGLPGRRGGPGRAAGRGRGGLFRVGIEFLVYRGDARERITAFVEAEPAPDRPGAPAAVLPLTVRPFEEAREWEEELRASEIRKALILDSAIDCILTADHEGRIIEFNAAARRLFGYSRSEILGREVADTIVPPALRDELRRCLRDFVLTGESSDLGRRREATAMRADGSLVPVEVVVVPAYVKGRVILTAYIRDLSDRRRGERLATARQRATQALTASLSLAEASPAVLDALVHGLDCTEARLWVADGDPPAPSLAGTSSGAPAALAPGAARRLPRAPHARGRGRGVGRPAPARRRCRARGAGARGGTGARGPRGEVRASPVAGCRLGPGPRRHRQPPRSLPQAAARRGRPPALRALRQPHRPSQPLVLPRHPGPNAVARGTPAHPQRPGVHRPRRLQGRQRRARPRRRRHGAADDGRAPAGRDAQLRPRGAHRGRRVHRARAEPGPRRRRRARGPGAPRPARPALPGRRPRRRDQRERRHQRLPRRRHRGRHAAPQRGPRDVPGEAGRQEHLPLLHRGDERARPRAHAAPRQPAGGPGAGRVRDRLPARPPPRGAAVARGPPADGGTPSSGW